MDIELLRTLVAVIEGGSFARAAKRRHITQSTVSQQLKRLSEHVGHKLFAAQGRRRVPTPSAELLSNYARKLIALSDEARQALSDGASSELVRVGTTQDFSDVRLPAILRAMRQSNPRVRVEVRVGASQELARLLDESALELAVLFDASQTGQGSLSLERGAWLAGRGFTPPTRGEPWPLALFDSPCVFRDRALERLDNAGVPWRVVYSTPSLGGLLATVRAGIAITLRLAHHAQKHLYILGAKQGLPSPGAFRTRLLVANSPSRATRTLAELVRVHTRGRARSRS